MRNYYKSRDAYDIVHTYENIEISLCSMLYTTFYMGQVQISSLSCTIFLTISIKANLYKSSHSLKAQKYMILSFLKNILGHTWGNSGLPPNSALRDHL